MGAKMPIGQHSIGLDKPEEKSEGVHNLGKDTKLNNWFNWKPAENNSREELDRWTEEDRRNYYDYLYMC